MANGSSIASQMAASYGSVQSAAASSVQAVAPGHKELATIQMFKLWTNAGNKHVFHNPTHQVTEEQIVALIRGM
eukprot:4695570-Karenia_brevis.AAC.1